MSVKVSADKNFRRPKSVKPTKKKAAKRTVPWRAAGYAAAGVLGLYSTYRAFDLVLRAEMLQVHRISVHGNVRVSSGEVNTLMEGLRGTNILTADLTNYRARLLESPWVADAALRRILPSTVEVFVSERRPIGLCRLGTLLYLVDRTGTLIGEFGPQYAEFDLPLLNGILRSPSSGEPSVDERRVDLAARVMESLAGRADIAGRVSEIDVSDAHNAVVLLDGDPALLHLGEEKFAERLSGYLDLAETFRDRVADIDYVDLRFENRVYVRPAGAGVVQAAGRPPAEN